MKNLTLFIAFIIVGFSSIAQDFEGTITYGMTYENLSPQVKPQAGMLPKSAKLEIKGEFSKTTTPSAMGGEIVIIQNITTENTLQLMNMMGMKIATPISAEEKKKLQGEAKNEIEYTDETKEILGYSCKKAIVTDKDGIETEVYYTEELGIKVLNAIEGIKGFPLMTVINRDEFTMTQTVTEIKKGKVKKIKMDIPSDYEVKTIEELKAM